MKINFIRTMKSAGTTVQSILGGYPHQTYILLSEEVYEHGKKTNSWAGTNIYYNRAKTDLMSAPRFVSDSSWTFGFVRNPWDRMVSAWKWSTGGKMSFRQFVTTDIKDMDSKLLIVRPLHVMQIRQTQFKLLTDKNNDIGLLDHICKFENIDNEVKLIREKLGANTNQPVPHLRATSHKHYKEYYTDDLVDSVAKEYEIDIRTFKYEY